MLLYVDHNSNIFTAEFQNVGCCLQHHIKTIYEWKTLFAKFQNFYFCRYFFNDCQFELLHMIFQSHSFLVQLLSY